MSIVAADGFIRALDGDVAGDGGQGRSERNRSRYARQCDRIVARRPVYRLSPPRNCRRLWLRRWLR